MHCYEVTLVNGYAQRVTVQIQAGTQYAADRAAKDGYPTHTVVAVRRIG